MLTFKTKKRIIEFHYTNNMDYTKYLNKNAASIQPSGIRKFFDIVAERPDAISLGVGEPDFDTPWVGREAAIRSIQKGYTQYTSNFGMPKLRELVSKYYKERYELEYNPSCEIMCTVGASEAIDLALRTLVSEGEEVLVPDPSYVSYKPCVTLAGATPVPIKCSEKNDFKVTPEALEAAITSKSKVLILPYPNNPTGSIMDKDDLAKIVPIILKHDLLVISDEIYSELTYTEKGHVSIATFDGIKERCVVVNGFSKAFAMTGWRLGYACAPKEIINVMYKIHQYGIMCCPTASQYAGIACLENGFNENFSTIEDMKEQYNIRRRFLVSEFNKMGLHCFEPKGAFYVFPCVESLGMDGEEFANTLFKEKNLAVVPGSAFGDSGKNFIRVSYAYSMQKLEKAIDLIKDFVNEHKK